MDPVVSFQQATGCSSSNPVAFSIPDTSWHRGEETAKEILLIVHPTVVSEQKRMAVTEYIRRIFEAYPGNEVYAVGSVPLKTYLPGGDINLTCFCSQNKERNLADYVRDVLERGEKNSFADFEVRNIQYINAEVDRKIGKDHIFKRSIIFIKSWCYYEGRILGARHGLLSSYALETLVLYIFQLFHSCIDGPLSALYKFLDYYGKFDWGKYCISLSGPVCTSSLPEIVVEKPEKDEAELLLSKEYLKYCADMFSVPQKPFLPRHTNIIDPLKEDNNLGCNIIKANFYRIRSCFSYGAKDLRKALTVPEERIAFEIRQRFSKIIDRHGSGSRLDVEDNVSSGSVLGSIFNTKDSLQDGINQIMMSSESYPQIVETSSIKTELGTSIRCHDTEGSLADLSGQP